MTEIKRVKRAVKSALYKQAWCKFVKEGEGCRFGAKCTFAHSVTDISSHNACYKKSMCQDWIRGTECPLGVFCMYAHSELEFAKYAMKGLSDTDFFMCSFRLKPCPLKEIGWAHDWAWCGFYHGPLDKRRDPDLIDPSLKICECKEVDCNHPHSAADVCYHPRNYRTTFCRRKACEFGLVCSFAHSSTELRTVKVNDNGSMS